LRAAFGGGSDGGVGTGEEVVVFRMWLGVVLLVKTGCLMLCKT